MQFPYLYFATYVVFIIFHYKVNFIIDFKINYSARHNKYCYKIQYKINTLIPEGILLKPSINTSDL